LISDVKIKGDFYSDVASLRFGELPFANDSFYTIGDITAQIVLDKSDAIDAALHIDLHTDAQFSL
jgi:hypothetical protein